MKSFFASFFGTLAALTVLVGAVAIGLAILVGSVSSKREATSPVVRGSWLVFELSDQIQDTPLQNEDIDDVFEALGDGKVRALQARKVTRALQAAAADDDIAGLYLSGQETALTAGSGYGALREIRDAILAFRAAGKPVKAWLTNASTREYYLASAADDVVLDPFGSILLPGLATQPMFYTGAFEKIGIGVQVTRVGKYKSAVEPYTRTDMSPENRAQTQKLLDDLWASIASSIEESRKLTAGGLQAIVDAEGLLRGEEAREAGLVDRIAYFDEILDELHDATGMKSSKGSFRQISIADYAALVPGTNLVAKRRVVGELAAPAGHEKIAIVYAEGPILDGSGNDKGVVWGDDLSRELRKLRRDDGVKAVVLRVNSPGGSVTGSEAIGREVRLIQKKKPLVVSMGTVAASGGYWIATFSDRIFAEPTSITGSIGVFGLLFNVQDLATEKLGLHFDTVKTGRFADSATITRPKTEAELAIIQKGVDWVYDQFLAKVADSRRLEPGVVAEIAQGRVWSGVEAARIGLVDELGSLDAAIAFAAAKAAVGDEFSVVEVPHRKKFVEALAEAFDRKHREKVEAGVSGSLVREVMRSLAAVTEYNDPRGIYARLPLELSLP